MLKNKFPRPSKLIPSPSPPIHPSLPAAGEGEDHIVTILKQCQTVQCFKQVHSHMLTNGIYKPNHLLSKIVQLKDLDYSTLIFSSNPQPNDFSYNVVIRGLVTTWHDYPLALQYYLRMIRSGEKPNHYTYPFVLIASANIQLVYYGATAHASIFKVGLSYNDHVQHSLITMYARCGDLGVAHKVFDEIALKDSVSWNSMISGYAKMGYAREAMGLFRRMEVERFRPDEVTLVSVLAACGDLGDLRLGMELERLVEENRLDLNSYIGSAMIDMYGKCGDLTSARRVFDGIKKKDLAAWNAMITGQVHATDIANYSEYLMFPARNK